VVSTESPERDSVVDKQNILFTFRFSQLHKVQHVQVSDTTGDAISTVAGYQKKLIIQEIICL